MHCKTLPQNVAKEISIQAKEVLYFSRFPLIFCALACCARSLILSKANILVHLTKEGAPSRGSKANHTQDNLQ